MMSTSHDRPAHPEQSNGIYTRISRTTVADKIGRELRSVYDEMTAASQPDHLVELAILIDDRRRPERSDF